MKLLDTLSLKTRIILVFSLITTLLVALTARISYTYVKVTYLSQAREQIERLGRITAGRLDVKFLDFIQPAKNNLARSHYQADLRAIVRQMQLRDAFIFNKDWQIVVSTDEQISPALLQIHRNEILQALADGPQSSLPFRGRDNNWYLWAFTRLNGQYILGVQETFRHLAVLDSLGWKFLGLALAGIALTIAAAWLLARAIIRPLDRLVHFSEQIGAGRFKSKPPAGISGELAVMEKALTRMRDQLAETQAEKERILAQIAHELRNPLGGIELLAGLIRENLPQQDKNTTYLKKIIDEIHGLKGQINAYLQFSRPPKTEQELVNLTDLLRDIESNFADSLESKNVRLQLDDRAGRVWFDAGHLKQILINLMANSLAAMDGRGQIRISTTRCTQATQIAVSDDGCGIGDEQLPHIFEPYYTSQSDGTGLGLAISKKLCEENGARIRVENNPERGCTFTIEIPDRKS